MYRESAVAVAEIDLFVFKSSDFHISLTSSVHFSTNFFQLTFTEFLSGYTVSSHCMYFATIARRDKSRASADKKA